MYIHVYIKYKYTMYMYVCVCSAYKPIHTVHGVCTYMQGAHDLLFTKCCDWLRDIQ